MSFAHIVFSITISAFGVGVYLVSVDHRKKIGWSLIAISVIALALCVPSLLRENSSAQSIVNGDRNSVGDQNVINNGTINLNMPQSSPSLDAMPNKYVCITNITPLMPSKAKYAVLIEFGVHRESTNGIFVAVLTDHNYSNPQQWTGAPLRTDRAGTPFVAFNISHSSIPPLYKFGFSDPSITPRRSFYVYLEADQPLIVQRMNFIEDYDARSDQTRVAQLLRETTAACPR